MTKSDLIKLSGDELFALSENTISDFRWKRSSIYEIAYEKYEKNGLTNKQEDMKRECLIFDLRIDKTNKSHRFHSKMTGNTDTGDEWKYPDLEKDFPNESLEYYKIRANTTNNPILKARYSDVIWELRKDINYARLSVAAYLDTCLIYFNNVWDHELSDSLERAMAMSVMIKDQSLIENSLKKYYEFINHLVYAKRFGCLLEIIVSILERAKILKEQVDYMLFITIVEEAILYYKQNYPDNFLMERNFLELLIKIYHIKKDEENVKKTKIRIAESFEEEGEWKKINTPKSNLVAAIFYEQAMKIYMDLCDKQKSEELKVRIQEANKEAIKTEYQSASSTIEIPREEIEKHLLFYKGHKTIEVFQIMFLDKRLIPSYEISKQLAIEQAKEFVVQHLFPTRVMKENICVKEIFEDKEKLEYNTIGNFIMSYRIKYIILNEIFMLLKKEHPDYIGILMEYLTSSKIIDNERLKIIKHGIRFFEKEEYLASIHILVFQIEVILRDLLDKLGLPTFSYRNNEMRERMLSDILETLMQINGIDKDLLKFIEIFLCNIFGDNYRNNIAHGLLKEEVFTEEIAQFMLLILIKLALYEIIQKEKIDN